MSVVALNGQPVRAFNESVTTTFYVWLLGCVLRTDNATAHVRGDGVLLSLNATASTPFTPFPYLDNEPQNAMESWWISLLEALFKSQGGAGVHQGSTWVEDTLERLLLAQPDIATLETNLASMTSFFYALVIQHWRTRYGAGDPSVAQNWTPSNTTVQGHHPVLKGRLQIDGIPLIVGCISTLILTVVSLSCVRGHDTNDTVVRDGGVIDLISLLHDSALPDIIAGDGEGWDAAAERAMFETRSSRARRVLVA